MMGYCCGTGKPLVSIEWDEVKFVGKCVVAKVEIEIVYNGDRR